MREITIKIHEIATDGLPDMDQLTGRVAFIFDGCVSGWPLVPKADYARAYAATGLGIGEADEVLWEGNSDVADHRPFSGVTHWIEFSIPLHVIETTMNQIHGGRLRLDLMVCELVEALKKIIDADSSGPMEYEFSERHGRAIPIGHGKGEVSAIARAILSKAITRNAKPEWYTLDDDGTTVWCADSVASYVKHGRRP